MQIVYLSNRPKILNDTLIQVKRFMRFIDSVVVICPENQKGLIQSQLPISFIFEEQLLGDLRQNHSLDHQALNYFLRAKAIQQDIIEPSFILSDDDARPVRPVSEELFFQNGKYRSYFFYELDEWHFHRTDFDKGQQNTFVLLKQCNYPTKSFAAHMPQIIDRQIFLESYQEFLEYSQNYPICEWTSYFNYAKTTYADRFFESEPYLTLNWPKYPGDWPQYVVQSQYYFENCEPQLYLAGGIYEGLSPTPDARESDLVLFEKSRRLRMIECGRYIAPVQKNDPWRIKSWKHRLLYPLVRLGNGYIRKAMIELRTQITKRTKFSD